MEKLPLDAQHRAADVISRARVIFQTAIQGQLEETGMHEFTAEHVPLVLAAVGPQLLEMTQRMNRGESLS